MFYRISILIGMAVIGALLAIDYCGKRVEKPAPQPGKMTESTTASQAVTKDDLQRQIASLLKSIDVLQQDLAIKTVAGVETWTKESNLTTEERLAREDCLAAVRILAATDQRIKYRWWINSYHYYPSDCASFVLWIEQDPKTRYELYRSIYGKKARVVATVNQWISNDNGVFEIKAIVHSRELSAGSSWIEKFYESLTEAATATIKKLADPPSLKIGSRDGGKCLETDLQRQRQK